MQIRAINPPFPLSVFLSLFIPQHTRTLSLYFPGWWSLSGQCSVIPFCHKLTMNGPNHAALPCSFSTSELNINAAWQQ